MPKERITCANRTLDTKLNAYCKVVPGKRCIDVSLPECQFEKQFVEIKEVETCLSSE